MSCLTNEQLGALADGAAGVGDVAWEHLAGCATCAALLEAVLAQLAPEPTRRRVALAVEGRVWAKRFELRRLLGAGRRGVTFEAVDVRSGALRAVQVLQPRSGRWPTAARALLRWRHPGAVAVHALGVSQGQPWLACALVPGAASLRGQRRPWPEVREAFAAVAETLERAHAAGVTHGAVSPGAVLLSKTGALLTDFAVALAPPLPPDACTTLSLDDAAPLTDAQAFCRTLGRCVEAPPAAVAKVVEAGLRTPGLTMAALREALFAP